MTSTQALIVDDEPDILELLEITLQKMGITTQKAGDLQTARNLLSTHHFDLCLTDMHLPDGDGIDLVTHIQTQFPETPVAVITAYGSMETAINALKAGAFDFVSKPVELPRLRAMVEQALTIGTSSGDSITNPPESQILGCSPIINTLRQKINKVSRSQAPIYISGESGTGKELGARLIHSLGPRRDKPFVPVNCGAIPGELMESEFFGHKKGSFTGAIADRQGLFQVANGGTLFFDEVADLPLHMQVKLLRVLQEKSIRPVGTSTEVPVDVRVISATHKDLATEVEAGRFRQDLYYRINVIEIKMPSLRERSEDIPLFTDHILDKLHSLIGGERAQLSPAALESLKKYSFPGNVRELENMLERAFTLSEGNKIELEDLLLDNGVAPHETALEHTETEIPESSLDDYLGNIEKQAILKALADTRWNRTAAAEKLGISFRQMRHRLKKFGLDE